MVGKDRKNHNTYKIKGHTNGWDMDNIILLIYHKTYRIKSYHIKQGALL